MTQGASRLGRWQDQAADQRRAPAGTQSSLVEDAQAAMEAATVASRSARDRLERWRNGQEARIVAITVLGAAAMAGLFGILVVAPASRTTTLALAAAAMCAAIGAGIALAWEGWPKQRPSDEIAGQIAEDFLIADQARLLAQLAASLDERPAPSAASVLSRLVAEVDRSAGMVRGREARIRGEADLRGRRHDRLVPRQTRTVLTTPDSRSLHARIVDISLSGVAVDGNFPGCGVGARIRVGSRSARVVRVLPRGLACEFHEYLPPGMLTADIVL